jgi:hypothetical protein
LLLRTDDSRGTTTTSSYTTTTTTTTTTTDHINHFTLLGMRRANHKQDTPATMFLTDPSESVFPDANKTERRTTGDVLPPPYGESSSPIVNPAPRYHAETTV